MTEIVRGQMPEEEINRIVGEDFWKIYENEGPEAATTWFYDEALRLGYVHPLSETAAMHWGYDSKYGEIEITVNAAKPEKDPRDIAAARKSAATTCPFCKGSPAYDNHLRVPLPLHDAPWTLHYSPYGYFNEHCIVADREHVPMATNHQTFQDLADLVEIFPNFFFGSNADLPIVGGSILSHDHYQGGNHIFPLDKAPLLETVKLDKYPEVTCHIVDWPLSVVRLDSTSKEALVEAVTGIHEAWRNYSNEEFGILAHDEDGTPHNTTTPIARKVGDTYQMLVALRCNITSDEHPLGVFHPHEEVHRVKKENIGLIEVMGLAILPPRIAEELDLAEGGDDRELVGRLFTLGLEHCAVFPKTDEGFAAMKEFLNA